MSDVAALEAFIRAVEAQRGTGLADTEADRLVADATSIVERIESGAPWRSSWIPHGGGPGRSNPDSDRAPAAVR